MIPGCSPIVKTSGSSSEIIRIKCVHKMPKLIEVLVRRTYLIFSCLSFLLATIGIFGDLFIDEPSTRIAWGDLGFYAISFWAFVTLTLWLIKKLTYKF